MNTYVDVKYLNLLSHRLERFSKKGDYLWNFRCPYCGDSEKQIERLEGYVYRVKVDLSINVTIVQREQTYRKQFVKLMNDYIKNTCLKDTRVVIGLRT